MYVPGGAENAITLCDKAVTQVASIRTKLGAYENRNDHAISNLDVSSENILLKHCSRNRGCGYGI